MKNHSAAKFSRRTIRFLLACCLGLFINTGAAFAEDRVAVVILVDGLTPSFIQNSNTPTLDMLAKDGVSSDHLVPVYPTVSMSNHVSFTTGCWPKTHGIMSNRFRDPVKGLYDSSMDADWVQKCESLFETAERQGIKSAAIGITGAHSSKNGKRATYVSKEKTWVDYPSDSVRADEVAALLALPASERPSLIVAYFQEPDHSVHYQEHASTDTKELMASVDMAIGKVKKALDALPKGTKKALFIGADHGHAEVTKLVNIQRIMRKHDIEAEFASSGTSSFLYFSDKATIPAAKKALATYDFLDVYEKTEQPDFMNIGAGARVGDLIVQAKPPFWIEDPDIFPWYAHMFGITRIWPVAFEPPAGGVSSTHGYPPNMPEMHGAFYAWGDGIERGSKLPALNQIDIHPSVARWLGMNSGPYVDGKAVSEIYISR